MTTLAPFLLLILLPFMLPEAEGCSCIFPSKQDLYCNADFVIRVKIKGKKTIGSGFLQRLRYRIAILKKFRSTPGAGYGGTNKDFLWTAAQSATCGVTGLVVGETYLIAGSVSGTELTINLCQWYPTWNSLTSFQKKAVKKTWKKQCGKCKIKLCNGCVDCYGVQCSLASLIPPPPADTCILNTANKRWDCYEKYSVCRKKNGLCSFKPSSALTKCKKLVIIPPIVPIAPIIPIIPFAPIIPIAPVFPIVPFPIIKPVIPIVPIVPIKPIVPFPIIKPIIPIAPIVPIKPIVPFPIIKPIIPIAPIVPIKPIVPFPIPPIIPPTFHPIAPIIKIESRKKRGDKLNGN